MPAGRMSLTPPQEAIRLCLIMPIGVSPYGVSKAPIITSPGVPCAPLYFFKEGEIELSCPNFY